MTSLGEKVWTIPEESEPNSTWGGSVGLGLLGAHGALLQRDGCGRTLLAALAS